jgi:hypothetical protein
MNIDVDEALSLFSSTLAGQSEVIRKYGIDTSAAAVATFALANGIGEAGATLSAEDKVLATYGLLMEATSDVTGDFAATSEDLANSQRTLAAEFENAKIELGEQLLPAMQAGVKAASGLLKVTVNLGKGWSRVQNRLLPFADGVKDATFGMIDLASSYRGAGVDLFNFGQVLRTVTLQLEDGQDVVKVAGDALMSLGVSGSLTEAAMFQLKAELKLTDAQFLEAANRALFMAATAGVASDEFAVLEVKAGNVADTLDKDLVRSEEDAAEGARDMAFETLQAARAADKLRRETFNADKIVKIFAGDLFAAARAAGTFKRSTGGETLGALFAGGGGSGQTRHGGGIVAGPQGSPQTITALGGEQVLTRNQQRSGGGGGTFNITVNSLSPDDAAVLVVDAIRSYEDRFGSIR